MSELATIKFEDGYRRLQEIAEHVNSEDVPVDELCELFSEGKGLEKALTSYLSEQKARVEKIERGEGIKSFQIASRSEGRDESGDVNDFLAPGSGDFVEPASEAGVSNEDDIPF